MLAIALLAQGCISSSLAELVEKAGDNTSTLCITVHTFAGSGRIMRTNPRSREKVRCDMDGMFVEPATP